MRQGQDITARFPGVFIIHQKIRGNTVERHDHAEHELFFPLQGEIAIETGDRKLRAGPGKMIYLPPGTAHSFQASSSAQGERIILIVEDRAWRSLGGGRHEPAVANASQLGKELVFHLLLHPKTKVAKALLETLIGSSSEMLEESGLEGGSPGHLEGRANDERVRKALAIVASRYAKPLSIDELARGAGLSSRNLNRLFLEQLGITPKQAITLHRIERAKALLARGRISVTDVAYEVGYASVSQFITTFRKATGQLPSRFSPAG